MGHFLVHENATGRIICTGNCTFSADAFLQRTDPENQTVLLDIWADDATQYINGDGELADRPALTCAATYEISANGVHEVSFPLPAGTMIRYEGQLHEATGGFYFTTDLPGRYQFGFEPPFPFIEKSITIHAL